MSLIQILTVLFVIFAGSRVILRFHDKQLGYGALLFWSGVWTLILLIVFRPTLADQIALTLGIGQGTDAMFFFAVVLLFYLLFRLYVKIEILDKTFTKFNTNISKTFHKQRKEK